MIFSELMLPGVSMTCQQHQHRLTGMLLIECVRPGIQADDDRIISQ